MFTREYGNSSQSSLPNKISSYHFTLFLVIYIPVAIELKLSIMKTSFCIFILLATLAFNSLALYPTQIGKFDWNKRNIGELDFALIKNYKIFFKSENNVIGSVSTAQGTNQQSS
jgi:uncharacterized membrane protein